VKLIFKLRIPHHRELYLDGNILFGKNVDTAIDVACWEIFC
jgi:hypothetical protein